MDPEFPHPLQPQGFPFDEPDEEFIPTVIVTILLAGILVARETRNNRRQLHRLYLCRNELLPNPREGTPWQQLWRSESDRAFITTMGFDVATFRLLLDGPGHFAERWNTANIPRTDLSNSGQPRPGGRSLDAPGALGLVLHYLNSAMLEVSLQQIFALIPATVSRYLSFARDILYETLLTMKEASISWPRHESDFQHFSHLIVDRHPLLTGAFASIDGLSLPLQESDDPEIENATYNGWKSSHCISNVLVFSPEGVIISAVLNAPGSWHDSHVAQPIFEQLRSHVPDGYYLVADTAFPRGAHSILGKIKAPLKAGQHIPADPIEQQEALQLNRQLLSYRQTAEWGMRTLQGSFGRLRVPLPVGNDALRKQLLETCVRLSNVRARCVGINQIRNVYVPMWKASEDERLWTDLGAMMFGDIRQRDRVSRFHITVDDDN